MQGGRTRDFVVLRAALAASCAALLALIAAPTALAGTPATDQYGSALPGVGGGGSDQSTSGSGSGSGTEATIPVAKQPSSSSQPAGGTEVTTGGGGEASGTNAASSGGGAKAGSSHGADKGQAAAKDDSAASVVGSENTSHAVPQIAAESAGDGWVPFFIAGLVALGAAGAILIYRNRRRTAQS
jgi:hypothetical protein